jgi:hypothetical protein
MTPRASLLAVPRADRETWTIEDLAAEFGVCARTIRNALNYRPHTVPAPIAGGPTKRGHYWHRDTVRAFCRSTSRHRWSIAS